MATSGQSSFDLNIDDIINEAFEDADKELWVVMI